MANAKRPRQHAILRLIRDGRIATQGELARALRRAGFHATQATVSRDILELGLLKVRAADGDYYYAASPDGSNASGPERLRRFCEDYPVDGGVADSIVVLRSSPGTANALAAAIDACGLSGVVGTLAGDDTVFVATRSSRASREVLREFGEFGIVERSG